jgi:hypothetical protein
MEWPLWGLLLSGGALFFVWRVGNYIHFDYMTKHRNEFGIREFKNSSEYSRFHLYGFVIFIIRIIFFLVYIAAAITAVVSISALI